MAKLQRMPTKGIRLLTEDENIRVVCKDALCHSVSLREDDESAVALYKRLCGLPADDFRDESGLLYRLDYRTSGLLVFARTAEVLEELRRQTVKKTYRAYATSVDSKLDGIYGDLARCRKELDEKGVLDFESYFRSYGRNAAYSRPVFAGDTGHFSHKRVGRILYSTHIEKSGSLFLCSISRGAKHQIRSTLACLGYPIDGDVEYGSRVLSPDGSIGLECSRVEFRISGVDYRLDLDVLKQEGISENRGQ